MTTKMDVCHDCHTPQPDMVKARGPFGDLFFCDQCWPRHCDMWRRDGDHFVLRVWKRIAEGFYRD
jgi:hypothetical protein